jgi:polysaccharide export outer membrane protein
MQALALAGGPQSPADETSMRQLLGDLGNLEDLSREIVRARAREIRLLAEVEGRTELRFPDGLLHPDGKAATALMRSEEEAVFTARRAALERELESLGELKNLLETEIATLEAKLSGQARQLALVR